MHTAVLEADATLIHVRVSELDIAACRAVVDLCHPRRKPFAFILTQVKSKPDFRKITMPQSKRRATGGRVLEAIEQSQCVRGSHATRQDRPRNRMPSLKQSFGRRLRRSATRRKPVQSPCSCAKQEREHRSQTRRPAMKPSSRQTSSAGSGKKRYFVGVRVKSASQQPEPMAQMGNAP